MKSPHNTLMVLNRLPPWLTYFLLSLTHHKHFSQWTFCTPSPVLVSAPQKTRTDNTKSSPTPEVVTWDLETGSLTTQLAETWVEYEARIMSYTRWERSAGNFPVVTWEITVWGQHSGSNSGIWKLSYKDRQKKSILLKGLFHQEDTQMLHLNTSVVEFTI